METPTQNNERTQQCEEAYSSCARFTNDFDVSCLVVNRLDLGSREHTCSLSTTS